MEVEVLETVEEMDLAVTVGGAALGGSIAGVYGAVIGAILAAGCGWYITFRKAKSA